MSGKKETVTAMMGRTSRMVELAVRILGMQIVLAPAARWLPRNLAMAVADAIAFTLIFLPKPGFEAYWKMRSVYGKGRLKSLCLAWIWLARPFRDFVVMQRVVAGRGIRRNLRVVEHNSASIRALRESGESYIIAAGHFAREAAGTIYLPRITPGHLVIVSEPLPGHSGRLGDIRTRLQLGSMLKASSAAHSGNETIIYTKSKQPASGKIYAKLRGPGNAAVVNIDAPVKGGGPGFVWRAFAGSKKMAFSLGAIKLARLSGCAIIGCICYLRKDGATVIEWSDALRLPEDGTKSDDMLAMKILLDRIELAIGRRPEQYVLDIGYERRWDAGNEAWIDF